MAFTRVLSCSRRFAGSVCPVCPFAGPSLVCLPALSSVLSVWPVCLPARVFLRLGAASCPGRGHPQRRDFPLASASLLPLAPPPPSCSARARPFHPHLLVARSDAAGGEQVPPLQHVFSFCSFGASWRNAGVLVSAHLSYSPAGAVVRRRPGRSKRRGRPGLYSGDSQDPSGGPVVS